VSETPETPLAAAIADLTAQQENGPGMGLYFSPEYPEDAIIDGAVDLARLVRVIEKRAALNLADAADRLSEPRTATWIRQYAEEMLS
jgi:hypothetical protein